MAATTYRGSDARIYISGSSWSTYGLSDFSITIDRGTVEQELVCEKGNYFTAGSLSIDGSFTACKLSNSEGGPIIAAMINGTTVAISGNAGTNSIHFYFKSAMITGFDLSIGDADTMTEGSIDWTLKYPQNVTTVTDLAGGGTYIHD